MEVNELRFGNWLKDGEENFQVEKAFFTLLELNMKFCKPIPLTEEWLLKFGFEKEVYDSDIYNGVEYNLELNGLILNYCDDFSLTIHLERKDFGFLPDLNLFKNVHQIQNLYFALTGKELTIKNQE